MRYSGWPLVSGFLAGGGAAFATIATVTGPYQDSITFTAAGVASMSILVLATSGGTGRQHPRYVRARATYSYDSGSDREGGGRGRIMTGTMTGTMTAVPFQMTKVEVDYRDAWNRPHTTRLCIYVTYFQIDQFDYCPSSTTAPCPAATAWISAARSAFHGWGFLRLGLGSLVSIAYVPLELPKTATDSAHENCKQIATWYPSSFVRWRLSIRVSTRRRKPLEHLHWREFAAQPDHGDCRSVAQA
jgi:hypothetical protein